MSFSIKRPINNQKDIHHIINQNKNRVCNGPINVKMCQIPNSIGFNNKIKANIISSSYFNLNIKDKSNINNFKNKNCKKARNKLNNDIKTNYYSLIIPNNRNTNSNINSTNIFNNYSKLSINSIINNSINNSKKIINNRKNNLINEEYSAINKQKNYSFKIKVNKIKENLIFENSRNNSLKQNNNSNYNYNSKSKPKTVISKDNIFNQSNIKTKSKKYSKKKIKNIKNEKFMKNCSVKSVFKKINLNNNNNIIKNSYFLSYSEQNKKRNDKIKRKIINSSYLINNLSSYNQNNIFNNIKQNDINKIHSRNNTTSSNTKIINDFSNINKVINKGEKKIVHFFKNNSTSVIKRNINQNNVLNNLNIENIKLKNNYVISPQIKYGTHILNNNYSYSLNYNSISDNINTLKNIIFKNNNNYNSNDNIKNYKKKLIKEIPAPKANKNINLTINKNNSNSIKNIKIKKISNNKSKEIKAIRNSKQIKKKKSIIKQKKEKEIINLNKDNYDRDDFDNENINKDSYKNKISIVEILKKNKDFKNINVSKNKKNKSFIGKRIKSIKVEKKSLNESKNSKLINYNNINSNYNIDNNKIITNNNYNNNKNNNNYYNINLNTKENNKSKEEIRNNKIDNKLFDKDNLIDLSSDNDDKFDDLYSIIKKINFNSILLNKEGIFSVGNKEYNNYIKKFERIFKKNIMRKNIKYSIKKSEKINYKDFTESTKMNTTSSKKVYFHKINKDNYIKEFKLDDIKNNEYTKIT